MLSYRLRVYDGVKLGSAWLRLVSGVQRRRSSALATGAATADVKQQAERHPGTVALDAGQAVDAGHREAAGMSPLTQLAAMVAAGPQG